MIHALAETTSIVCLHSGGTILLLLVYRDPEGILFYAYAHVLLLVWDSYAGMLHIVYIVLFNVGD